MKKIVSLILVGALLLIVFGCSNKGDLGKKDKSNTESQKNVQKQKQKPKTDPINDEQKKNPLPNGSKPYSGIIKKVDGSKVVIDIDGVSYEFQVTDKTNLQKGTAPGTGKLIDLKPQMKINVLTVNGKALTVHYE